MTWSALLMVFISMGFGAFIMLFGVVMGTGFVRVSDWTDDEGGEGEDETPEPPPDPFGAIKDWSEGVSDAFGKAKV